MSIAKVNQFGGLHFGQRDVSAAGIEIAPTGPPVTWQLRGQLDLFVPGFP